MTPEGVERPLHYLRSRILARHTHAMLMVTAYLEPGIRAPGLNLWLLEVLAACCLCFDGPWIAMVAWNMEPHELSQAGWLNTVNGKVFATSSVTCAGGASLSPRRGLIWCNRSKWMTTLPLNPHWPVRLTLKASSWGHRVLARLEAFPDGGCLWDHGDRRSASIRPARLERSPTTWRLLGWSCCAQPRLLGAASTTYAGPNAGFFWAGAKGWSSSMFPWPRQRARTPRRAAAKRRPLGERYDAVWHRLFVNLQPGGRGEPACTCLNVQSVRSFPHRRHLPTP